MKMTTILLMIIVVSSLSYIESKPAIVNGNDIVTGKNMQLLAACCPQDAFCCTGIHRKFLKKLSLKKSLR